MCDGGERQRNISTCLYQSTDFYRSRAVPTGFSLRGRNGKVQRQLGPEPGVLPDLRDRDSLQGIHHQPANNNKNVFNE